MQYTKNYFEEVVKEYGEVFFVLDSDREYEVHGTDQYEFKKQKRPSSGHYSTIVHIEGMREGEFLKVEFPIDSIEHHYTHREV